MYLGSSDLTDLRRVTPLPEGTVRTEPFGVTPDGSLVLFFADRGQTEHAEGDLYVVNADGTGLFHGRHGTAHLGERSFRITRQQYRAFAAQLAPYRPGGREIVYSGPPRCQQTATDLPSVTVVWNWRHRGPQRLHFDYGCDVDRNREMARQLRDAPLLLPIRDLIDAPR